MAVSQTQTGYMNIGVCAFYDGKKYYLGTSAAFEYPLAVIELIKKGFDVNQAFYSLKLTTNPTIGSSEGAIGILTHGRWNRKETAKQAIITAILQLENQKLYN